MKSGTIDSPFGPLSFSVDTGFVTSVQFAPGIDNFDGADTVMAQTAHQLREYVAAARISFNLPLAPATSDFQLKIRQYMIAIPYGEMRTYGELAKELGSGSRAIGHACGANPLPIIVPCHRVVAAGGKIGGFTGGNGATTKKKLLNHEAVYTP